MTVAASENQPRHLAPRGPRTTTILITGAVVATAVAVILPDSSSARWVVAALIGLTLLAVAIDDRVNGVIVLIGFLLCLGLLRRLLSMVQADPSDDPLLLVAPVVVGLVVLLLLRDGAARQPSLLTVLVGVFVVVSVVSVVNVVDLSVRTNAEGMLFWTVPLLWFPIGRHLVDEHLARTILRVVAVVGALSCLAGLFQVLVDLPPWDQRWFDNRGYVALGILGFDTLHPFGFAASAAEFAQTAAVGCMVCALELRDAWRRRATPALPLAAVGLAVALGALGLSAVRASQLLFAVAVVVVLLAARIVRPLHVAVALTVGALVLVGGVRILDVEDWRGGGVARLVQRSLLGLSDPLGETSSLEGQIDLTEVALRRLDDRPLGAGTAAATVAGSRGEGAGFGAENDLGDAAFAFGFVGVGLVVAITAVGLHAVWRRARDHPTVVTLAVLGTLVLSIRFWWHGSHYAMAALVWLLLGHTDRPSEVDAVAVAT
jgi:hypothetical protein